MLIVDADAGVREATKQYFTAYGFTVDAAADCRLAEAMLFGREYALVIVEVRDASPDHREGLHLLESIRLSSTPPKAIAITAAGSRVLEREARRLGASAYLHKPIPLSQLLATARTVLCQPSDWSES